MKRKTTTLIIALFAASSAIGQSYGYNYFFQIPEFHIRVSNQATQKNFIDSFVLGIGLGKVDFKSVYFNSHGKKSWTSYTTGYFDKQGRLIEMIKKHDSGRNQIIVESNQRMFDQHGNLVSSRTYYYGESNFMELRYNDSNNVTRETYYGKRRLSSSIEKTYNEQNLTSSILYKNRKGKERMSYTYYYYPDKKIKQVVKRNKKGKVSAIWDYSCDFSGKELKKLGDTAKYCTLKTYLPDGTIITTTQSFSAGGDPWKTVTQIDSMGRLVKYEYYSGKIMHLVYREEKLYSGKSLTRSQDNYYKKGKLYWSRIKEFDGKGAITADIHAYYKHGKVSKAYKSEYVYNHSGLIVYMRESLNDKLKYVQNFSYSFYR